MAPTVPMVTMSTSVSVRRDGKASVVNSATFDITDNKYDYVSGVRCGGSFITNDAADLFSPGWPGDYPDRSKCIWLIMMPNAQEITINVVEFNTEWNKDFVEIGPGADSYGTALFTLMGSGDNVTDHVTIQSNRAFVLFESDRNRPFPGFHLRYEISKQASTGGGPDEVTITDVTTTTSSITWSAVDGAEAYIVEYFPTDGTTESPVRVEGSAAREMTFEGLTAGRMYTYSVKAVIGGQESEASTTQGSTQPNMPGELVQQAATTESATIQWGAPLGGFESYELSYEPADGDPPPPIQVSRDVREYTVNGLSAGSTYSFSVIAINGEARSEASMGYASTVPNAVGEITSANASIFAIPLQWEAGEGSYESFEITYSPHDGNQELPITTSTTETMISELVPGKGYDISVSAVTGGYQGEARSFYATTAPMATQNTQIGAVTESSIEVTWEAPESGEFDHYEVVYSTGAGEELGTIVVGKGEDTAYTLEGLTKDMEYVIDVRAISETGVASESIGLSQVAGQANPCSGQPCQNGGMCRPTRDGGKECICTEGWMGPSCENMVELDLCNMGINPCSNGGTCNMIDGQSFMCYCPIGWAGFFCDERGAPLPCESNPCEHQGTCVDDEFGINFSCQCLGGWGGPTCSEELNRCDSGPCLNDGTCERTDEGYICYCTTAWDGPECQHDVDECVSNPCQNGGSCLNEIGDYFCDCPGGWTGPTCSEAFDPCESTPCENGATCEIDENGFRCLCVETFSGPLCEEKEFENYLCGDEPCNNGLCEPDGDTFICICDPGWTGELCDVEIIVTDEGITTDGMVTTEGVITTDGMVTTDEGITDGMVTTEGVIITDGMVTTDEGITDGMVTSEGVMTTVDMTATDVITGDMTTTKDIQSACFSLPCENDGTCIDSDETYICQCPAGFMGVRCEEGQ
ncbi:uncharacterized protein LOC144443259 [Glandiceps talaboti]